MTDDNDSSEDERTEEISSIRSIFPEIVIDPSQPYKLSLDLSVTPLQPLTVFFKPPTETTPPALPQLPQVLRDQPAVQDESHQISHLPPLSLLITLPEGYPATKPPFVSISCQSKWLPQQVLDRLIKDCENKWEEYGQQPVVFALIADLKTESEDAFGLAGTKLHLCSDLQLALLDFDLKAKREEFEKETFDCGICLEPKKGTSCHKMLTCGHVFCVSCLQDFYNSCITEGDVDSVKCLSPDCGKDDPNTQQRKRSRKQDRGLNPSELLQIPLEQEVVQRYVYLKRKKRLEADKNTIYCPREWCQGAAKSKRHPKPSDPMKEEDFSDESDDEGPDPTKVSSEPLDLEALPMSQRLSVCEDCDFAFCCVCRKGWHGELARCSPRRQKEITEEEAASLAYLNKYSTPCPTCNVRAQKILGCNHMKCFQCGTHFCYLCSAFLMPANPYAHFNDVASSCYQRLWVLEAGDGEGVDVNAHFNPDELAAELAVEAAAAEADAHQEAPAPNAPPVPEVQAPADLLLEEDDTSDEEPAPDVRRHERNMHIEFVNFAGPHGQNAQRVMLPERPRPAGADAVAPLGPGPPPPPAPNPPAPRRRRRRGAAQQRNRNAGPDINHAHAGRNNHPPAGVLGRNGNNGPNHARGAHADGPRHINGEVNAAAVQRGNPTPEAPEPAAPGHQMAGMPLELRPFNAQALENFLRLAEADQEDEWDSDELDDDHFGDIDHDPLPLEPAARRRRW
ncbi:hypothetical protein PV10_04127 [Exophiala mesophila]|uniref:RBR-type E3 ubiquitin transferase n=1 Tax=Exophiala mesophila TaxID=212818 RepID=A0A0D2A1D4_EXOME|nr:uncharacterized protein PV10_04127 [Exophiala mesophila]KIV92863.1 hypothetical protein PV10_04127 [Exophiala mesophila]